MGLGALLNNQLGHGPMFQKLHIHSLSIPGCQNWAYFCCMGSGFRDNGWFSKLPYLGIPKYGPVFKMPYLGMKLGKWPKFQRLRIYCLSTPGGRNWAYFRSTDSSFPDTADFHNCQIWAWNLAIGKSSRSCWDTERFSKLPYLGMKSGIIYVYSFHPRGSKLSLFLLYRQSFRDM